ncbi:MAG: hypothetical protein ACREBI_00660 [Nitrosotalea sp.]
MTENNTPKITRSTLGSSGNAPNMTKAQESVNAPSRQLNGSYNGLPVTNATVTKVSSKPIDKS